MHQYPGVMEWWSDGVMKGLIQFHFRLCLFQHSNTPKPLAIFTGKTIETLPAPEDQLFYN
jgi:hypothetical protein